MKPFDLELALAGEPVRLLVGYKAYVRYKLDDKPKSNYPLQGYYECDGKAIRHIQHSSK